MRVLLVTNIPSPYMVDYLDCLGKKCSVTALFEMHSATDRHPQWYGELNNKSFDFYFLNGIRVSKEAGLSFRVIHFLKKDFDRIIIANPTTPTGIVALLYCKWKKKKVILQSEGGFAGSGKGIKEKLKKFLMKDAAMYLSGMKGNQDYFLSYGATSETLKWYPFSSLHQNEIDQRVISKHEKENLKHTLGIYENQVVISVGQAIYRKGFDILLKSKPFLDEQVGLYIVGAELNSEYKKIIDEYHLTNVHFVNHCSFQELRRYYHSADIFVLPTREDTWGLVINEAMACGLPIITTEKCIAGLQLIQDDINGFIVKSEDIEAIANRITLLLQNEEKRAFMSNQNIEKIKPYNIENMAEIIFHNIQGEYEVN